MKVSHFGRRSSELLIRQARTLMISAEPEVIGCLGFISNNKRRKCEDVEEGRQTAQKSIALGLVV